MMDGSWLVFYNPIPSIEWLIPTETAHERTALIHEYDSEIVLD